MNWLTELTGIRKETRAAIHEHVTLNGNSLNCKLTGHSHQCGTLETPQLSELRNRVDGLDWATGCLQVSEQIGDVRKLHVTANAGSVFQVASQFNLLEMVTPSVTPDDGIGIYQNDLTQGPACAIACGAGTIYRNYFVPVNGQVGQTASCQIDCLADLGNELGNQDEGLWQMRNGYALASAAGLDQIAARINAADEAELDRLRGLLRVGVQHDTAVTIDDASHTVTQVFCSALPVAYSKQSADRWEPFARLVLEAAYEATLIAAIENKLRSQNDRLYLTLLGGGAFGNREVWIQDAIERALNKFSNADLNIIFVSYGSSNRLARNIIKSVS